MSEILTPTDAEQLIEDAFAEEDILIRELVVRPYPDETVFVIYVDEMDIPDAAVIANGLDIALADSGFRGFITVRPRATTAAAARGSVKKGIQDPRATEFVRLVASRSRASDIQPSLSYVRDAAANISIVTQARHHLIFGRRGAGKTSLMAEAKRLVERDEHLTVWLNMQTYRHEDYRRVFLWTVKGICDLIEVHFQFADRVPQVAVDAAVLTQEVELQLAREDVDEVATQRLIPRTQRIVRRFGDTTGRRLFVFLDDFHYMPRESQPYLLDMIHGCVRDCDAWLKVAAIRHLSRWFQSPPPVGLQTGHDADHIDLDVSLEEPLRAKTFLEQVLHRYASHVHISSLSGLFSGEALYRLVLASGAVPRDYLVLSSNAIQKARTRGANARLVGVQDVTNAAGDAAQVKIAELQDDLAPGDVPQTLAALERVREFCIEQNAFTYFRVDFRDKDQRTAEYDLLTNLLEARLVHLINPSVSDAHKAGERYEAFMLDVSQFSGQRFKKFLWVLDFEHGHLVARMTNRQGSARRGDTPRRLVTLLRRAPQFDLRSLADLVQN